VKRTSMGVEAFEKGFKDSNYDPSSWAKNG
jgi:hypothetical protein